MTSIHHHPRPLPQPFGPAKRLLLAAVLAAAAVTAPLGARASAVEPAEQIVFEDRFDTLRVGPGATWGWQTSAYSMCTDNGDPWAWKLDHLTTDSMSTDRGYLTITASPRADGKWNTGLLTTGDSCDSGGDGTQVRTGDLMVAHLRLPAVNSGGWPGLWTWRDGQNEMDVFEWHADRPNTLEFVNHVLPGDGLHTYTDPDLVAAGHWLCIGARFGADSVTWYVGPDLDHLNAVASAPVGVGPDFAAYPVLNLSIDDGNYHQLPTSDIPAGLSVDLLRIQRPMPVQAAGSGFNR